MTTKSKAVPTPASAGQAPAYWVAPDKVPFAGTEVVLAGHPYKLAPVPLRPLARFMPTFNDARKAQAAAPGDGEKIAKLLDLVVDLVHMALVRNYPQITADDVGNDLLDQSNWEKTADAVFMAAGVQQRGEPVAGSR